MLRTHPMIPDGEQRASKPVSLATGGAGASGLHGWASGKQVLIFSTILR